MPTFLHRGFSIIYYLCEQMPDDRSKTPRQISPEQYQRLKAEMVAPYRTLRQFVYVACGASGFIGALVFHLPFCLPSRIYSVDYFSNQ